MAGVVSPSEGIVCNFAHMIPSSRASCDVIGTSVTVLHLDAGLCKLAGDCVACHSVLLGLCLAKLLVLVRCWAQKV